MMKLWNVLGKSIGVLNWVLLFLYFIWFFFCGFNKSIGLIDGMYYIVKRLFNENDKYCIIILIKVWI